MGEKKKSRQDYQDFVSVDFTEVKEFFDGLVKKAEEKRKQPKFLLKETYLARLKKLAGTRIFQDALFEINGETVNLTKSGDLSCAAVVSGFLCSLNTKSFALIGEPHVTVDGVEKDLTEHGWVPVPFSLMKPGDIIIWEPRLQSDGKFHRHIGFYLGGTLAVSNDSAGTYPVEHHYTFGATRKIEKIYRHPALD